ncbi:hypothetical protein B0O80DRAFT_246524 [Mortierella sp. GBAus27b]|nr:hypothetical protein B0O80DRAFT_246524 [Mortierella sp. GBAus27b]
MIMAMDRTHTEPRTTISPALSELLGTISSAPCSSSNEASLIDDLVAFRKKSHASLSINDLTAAFRESFMNFDDSTIMLKVCITDWLADLVKSSGPSGAPTPVILELSKVTTQLNVGRLAEEWMPLLASLCDLADSCLGAVRRLDNTTLSTFLTENACMTLTSIVLGTGMSVFRHVDRTQTRRERSEGYLAWNQKTLNLTKNFQEFIGNQVQQTQGLREKASNVTISVCNMLLRYAEEARCEYAYLNIAFKCIIALVPNCKEDQPVQLETQNAIRLLCDGILASFVDIFQACVNSTEVSEVYISRRWTLAKFYIAHLRSLAAHLFRHLPRARNDAEVSRGHIRYLLFFMRGRFVTSEVIKRNHPQIHSEIVKAVGIVEDIVVSALLSANIISDEDKHALIHEFSMAQGPKAAFNTSQPLSEHEWNVGRLKFLLKSIAMFDEFSPELKSRLYPPKRITSRDSLIDRLVDIVDTVDKREFISMAGSTGEQESSDLYFRVLAELCSFVHLVQPDQFKRMQFDMTELALGQSELWSMLARDWWVCLAQKLGPVFTKCQAVMFVELLASLPIGIVSTRVSSLVNSMVRILDEEYQLAVAENIMEMIDLTSAQNAHRLLSSFPFDSLSSCNLESLINRCTNEWRDACTLMQDASLVVDALYAMHPHVACLASILSTMEGRRTLSDDTKSSLISWSVVIVTETQWVLEIAQDDSRSLDKISRTIEDIVKFLQSIQPLESEDMIKILDAILSWEVLPPYSQPLSRVSIAMFLSSCRSLEVSDGSHMMKMTDQLTTLYSMLLCDHEWTVKHAALISLIVLKRSTRYPQLVHSLEALGNKAVLDGPTEDLLSFWTMVESKSLRTQTFSHHTVSDLQRGSEAVPSWYACISAMSTIEQYLKTPGNAQADDGELRKRMVDMIGKVQRLAE